jgi:hypothetical protein
LIAYGLVLGIIPPWSSGGILYSNQADQSNNIRHSNYELLY